jgi:hypothetical protein
VHAALGRRVPPGRHDGDRTATDDSGNEASCTFDVEAPDALLSGTTLYLSAERDALCNGRVHVVRITATDADGNTASRASPWSSP